MFWLFRRKKEVEELKESVKKSFSSVKEDINSLSKWIEHLNNKDASLEFLINELKEEISSIKIEVEGLKNVVEAINEEVFKQVFKTHKQVFKKQTGVEGVQTPVQTGVQTGVFSIFSNLTLTERAIVSILLNTDLKLSYDDLAAMLGKSRATIRGQINSIKQKSEGLIEEIIEKNGKKRVFIPNHLKEKFLKNIKVRVERKEKKKEEAENE